MSSSYVDDIIAPLHGPGGLWWSANNDPGNLFSGPMKIRFFKTKLVPILIGAVHNLVGKTHVPIQESCDLMRAKMSVYH